MRALETVRRALRGVMKIPAWVMLSALAWPVMLYLWVRGEEESDLLMAGCAILEAAWILFLAYWSVAWML